MEFGRVECVRINWQPGCAGEGQRKKRLGEVVSNSLWAPWCFSRISGVNYGGCNYLMGERKDLAVQWLRKLSTISCFFWSYHRLRVSLKAKAKARIAECEKGPGGGAAVALRMARVEWFRNRRKGCLGLCSKTDRESTPPNMKVMGLDGRSNRNWRPSRN